MSLPEDARDTLASLASVVYHQGDSAVNTAVYDFSRCAT